MRIRLLAWVAAALLAAPTYAQSSDTYRVGPKDVLAVSVFGHPELSGKLTVAADGTILFPLIGQLRAADRTTDQIEQDLVARLSDGILRKPQVSVDVAEYVSRRVWVIGEVRTPGPQSLTGSTTLFEALARAGSLTENAGGEVLLLRPPATASGSGPVAPGQPGVTELSRVTVQQVRDGTIPANIQLQDDDTVFVPRAQTVQVLGKVQSPGEYRYQPGLTALRAVFLAGGVDELGTTGRITIRRLVNGQEIKLKAKESDLVKPGDTVIVGTRRF